MQSDETKSRIIFRNEQTGTIRMNVAIFSSMNPELAGEKQVKMLAVGDNGKPTYFIVRFSKPSEAATLLEELNNCISKLSGSAPKSTVSPATASAPVKPISPVVANVPAAKSVPSKSSPSPVISPNKPPSPQGTKQKREGSDLTPVVDVEAGPLKRKKNVEETKPLVVESSVAVCVFEQGAICGVVTISAGKESSSLLEASFQGLDVGGDYSIEVEGNRFALKGQNLSESLNGSVSNYVGKKINLKEGAKVIGTGIVTNDSPLIKE